MASISSARSPRTCGPPRRCNPRGGSRRDSSASRLGFQLVEPPPLGSSSRRRPTAVREKFNAARNFMNPSPQRKLGLNSACQKPRLVPGATERTGARRIGGGSRRTGLSRRPRASGDLPVVDLASAISVSQRPPRPRRRRPREWRFEISSPRRGPMNKKPGNIGISCRKTEVFPYSGDPIPSPRIPGGGRGLGPSTYWTSIGAMRACLDEVGRLPGSPIGTRQSRRKQETGYWDRRRTG